MVTSNRPAQAIHFSAVHRTSSTGRLGAALRDGLHRLSRAGSRRSSRRTSASEAGAGIQALASTTGFLAEGSQATAADAADAAEGDPAGLQGAAVGEPKWSAWRQLVRACLQPRCEPALSQHGRRLQWRRLSIHMGVAADGPSAGLFLQTAAAGKQECAAWQLYVWTCQ